MNIHAFSRADAALLADVRRATRQPFIDPVVVQGKSISRAHARALERLLWRIKKLGATCDVE